MKKLLCALMCLILLLPAMPALANPDYDVMQVVNCKEYVSLRKEPDTKSERLRKVHLGELVTDCRYESNDFISCDWDGVHGYILAKYLKPRTDIPSAQNVLKNQMVYNCNEYVSLRKEPDSSSERLIKVPLGAIVTGCVYWPGSFIRCEYKGYTGFIMNKYLKTADYTVKATPTPTVKPSATPTVKPTATPYVYYEPLPYEMVVVNCNEWVSLRAKPTPNSTQLARVPLSSVVTNCVQVNESYAACVYNGIQGYISLNYLEKYLEPETVPNGFSDLPAWPTYDQFKAVGEEILEYTFGGYTVCARRAYAQDSEELMIVCFNANRQSVWTTGGATSYITELSLTDAFVAGTPDKPLIVQFVSKEGFVAYEIGPWSDIVWELKNEAALNVSGSITTAVRADGTIYVIGYYNSAPICISNQGELLWVAENGNPNIYWPYAIVPGQDDVTVVYDSMQTDPTKCYAVSYGLDGTLRKVHIANQSDYPMYTEEEEEEALE